MALLLNGADGTTFAETCHTFYDSEIFENESFGWKRYVNNNSHIMRINLDANSQIAIFDAK